MKLLSITAMTVTACALLANAAHAATGSSRFGSIVAHSCTLTVGTNGVMMPNLDNDKMSSTNTGGAAGVVTALTTARGYRLSAIAPTAFTVKPALETGTHTFTARYSITGPTTATNVPGATETVLNRGSHNVAVNLDVATSSAAFANGTYEAAVLVRCE